MFEGMLTFAEAWQRMHPRRPATSPCHRGSQLLWWTGRASQQGLSKAFQVRGGACLGGITRMRFRRTGGIKPPTADGVRGLRTCVPWRSSVSTDGALKFILTARGLLISTRSKPVGTFQRWPSTNPGQRRLPMPRFFCRWPASTVNEGIMSSCFPCTRSVPPQKRCTNLWTW